MKVIITKRGLYRNTSPRTAGEFQYSAQHDAYLYRGREFSADEFNAFSDSQEWIRLIERHGSTVMVKFVAAKAAKKPAAPKKAKPAEPPTEKPLSEAPKYPVFAGPKANGRKAFTRTC